MKKSSTIRTLLLAFAILTLGHRAGAQDVMIVVNKGTSVSQITIGQLRDIFTGARSRFNNGGRALPVLLKGGPVHEVFLHHYVGDSPEEFRLRWRKAVFTGQGSMPREFATEAAMLDYVASTPGAIGYVSHVSDSQAVRVLTITADR